MGWKYYSHKPWVLDFLAACKVDLSKIYRFFRLLACRLTSAVQEKVMDTGSGALFQPGLHGCLSRYSLSFLVLVLRGKALTHRSLSLNFG
jgi:hypothetical protein